MTTAGGGCGNELGNRVRRAEGLAVSEVDSARDEPVGRPCLELVRDRAQVAVHRVRAERVEAREPLLLLGWMIESDVAVAALEPVVRDELREHRDPVGDAMSDERERVHVPLEDRSTFAPLASELDRAVAVARVVDRQSKHRRRAVSRAGLLEAQRALAGPPSLGNVYTSTRSASTRSQKRLSSAGSSYGATASVTSSTARRSAGASSPGSPADRSASSSRSIAPSISRSSPTSH